MLIFVVFNQEARTTQQRQLATNERQCKSYLTFANETVQLMHYLTKEAREPFLRAVSKHQTEDNEPLREPF